LRHPHKELAETLAKITPVYARTPERLKPVLRWMIARRMKRLALLLYICLIPLTFPFLGVEGIKVTLRMALRAPRGPGAPPRLPGAGGPTAHPALAPGGGRGARTAEPQPPRAPAASG